MPTSRRYAPLAGGTLVIVALAVASCAQLPAPGVKPATADAAQAKPDEPKAADSPLAALAWLAGCYKGTANQREFREQWLPLRGDLLVGASHTVAQGRTQDFSQLRVEPRADGVYYVITPGRQPEAAFRLSGQESDGPDRIFTFTTASSGFPQRIVYRRATEGWLYVHVEGRVGGDERRVIYPMRRVDCESDAFILQ